MTNIANITTTIAEITQLLLGLGISSLHPEYAGIINIVNNINNIQDLYTIKKCLIKIDERLKNIEENNVSLEYMSSHLFVDEIKQLLYIQERNDLEQKKELYANFFEHCCNCASISKINKEHYFKLLQLMDVFALSILKEIPVHYIAACNKISLVRKFCNKNPNLSYDDIGCCVDILIANGLAMYISDDDITKHPNRFGSIQVRGGAPYIIQTDLGKGFLNFISAKGNV